MSDTTTAPMTRDALRKALRSGDTIDVNGNTVRVEPNTVMTIGKDAGVSTKGHRVVTDDDVANAVVHEQKDAAVTAAIGIVRVWEQDAREHAAAEQVIDERVAIAEAGAVLDASTTPDTAEGRAASMSDDDLPPVPDPIGPNDSAPVSTPKRASSKHSRVVAGRIRSRATAAQYRVEIDESTMTPEQVEQIEALREHVAALDRYVDAVIADPANAGDERERDLTEQVSAFVHSAWAAGIPTTIIGSIIGASGGSARGRALRYAEANGLDRPEALRRTSSTLTPTEPVKVAARYADVLAPVYAAATNPDAGRADVESAIVAAFRTGVGVTSIARVAGVTPGTARAIAHKAFEAAGERIPSNDERRAARASLDVPALPDD